MNFRTGNRAYWSPDGFTVRIDTSWDGRGTSVACRTADIVSGSNGDASSLGYIEVRESAPVLTGSKVFRLRLESVRGNGGLGFSWDPRLSREEAEAEFSQACAEACAEAAKE